jgi:hypothetical protein
MTTLQEDKVSLVVARKHTTAQANAWAILSDCKGQYWLPKLHGKAAMHANKEVSVDAL